MNPLDMLKDAGKMKEGLDKMQDEMTRLTATGSSGGKMVNVTVNGQMEMTAIQIDPICVDARDVKMLEDLIVAANHAAMEKMREQIAMHFGALLGR